MTQSKSRYLGKTWYRRQVPWGGGVTIQVLEEDKDLDEKELYLKYSRAMDKFLLEYPATRRERKLSFLALQDGTVEPFWKDEAQIKLTEVDESGEVKVTVIDLTAPSRLMLGTFGDALSVLKRGGKVARKGWNGKNMCVFLDECIPRAEKHEGVRGRYIRQCLVMIDVQGYLVPGWLASQTDMLAEDWFELQKEEE